MAERVRKYNDYQPLDRPKLPRNKWGLLNTEGGGDGYSSSIFGSGSTSQVDLSGLVVGDVMAQMDEFIGATSTEDGFKGLVPGPMAGDESKFLQGSGTWIDIPAYRWLKEFPESDGLEKSGLTIDGNFNVKDTLSTLNLNVEGAAHFWTLIIDEVKANGGQIIVSPALFHVDHVGRIITYSLSNNYADDFSKLLENRSDIKRFLEANNVSTIRCKRLYMRCDDGSKRTENECVAGDMMRCRTFNVSDGFYTNVKNKDYWSFVVHVGEEPYYDRDNIQHEAFYIDLAYGMKTTSGGYIPLGSVLTEDGFTPPENWTMVNDIFDLKRISNMVLCGNDNVEDEDLDDNQMREVINKVIDIYGIGEKLRNLLGMSASVSLPMNYNALIQINNQLQYINSGVVNDYGGDDNMAQMIVDGGFTSDSFTSTNATTRRLAAARLVDDVLNTNTDIVKDRYSLLEDVVSGNDITIPCGTNTEKDYEVAHDIIDDNTGTTIYNKGDIINSGTVIPIDVQVVDNKQENNIQITDNESGQEIDNQELKDEVKNGTPATEYSTSRDAFKYVDVDYSLETQWLFGYGDFDVDEGDNLTSLGHLYDTDRQNAIVISSTTPVDPELEAPAIAQYSFIDRFGTSISNFRQTAIAKNGNEFIGTFMIKNNNKYIDVNERINLFINDLETGLESVGIHLDGENSTITLKGSVEIRQHSSESYDSLSVYDNKDNKKVEIIPHAIPGRSALSTTAGLNIDNSLNFNYITATSTASKDYINITTYKHGLFGWGKKTYGYELSGYNLNFTSSVNIGELKLGDVLDLKNFYMVINTKASLNGNTNVENRGEHGEQRITSLTYTLKRNGIAVPGQALVNILSDSGLSIDGEASDKIVVSLQRTFLNDYIVQNSGSYSIDYSININFYAWIEVSSYYSAPYFRFYNNISSSIGYSISDAAVSTSSDMSKGRTVIGTNGFMFGGNNSRYFYTGDEGFEMTWDDAGLVIDSNYGFKVNKLYTNISSTTTIAAKYDVVICDYSSSPYTVTLPATSDFGNGRILTIIGYGGLLVYSSNGVIRVPEANSVRNYSYIEMGTNNKTTSNTFHHPKYMVSLIAANNGYYILSYI